MTARIRVLDDHELLAQSVCYALAARGYDAAPLPVDEPDTVLAAVRAARPDVVLLDLQLGAPIGSGVTMVGPLTDAGARVLVVSGVDDPVVVAEAVEAGAVGFVAKSEPLDVLLNRVVDVASGRPVMREGDRAELLAGLRRQRAEVAAAREPFERLTPRERQVLEALAAGDAVTAIARRWYVSVPTVRTQVRAILLKLGVGSQLEAVAMAHRHRWYAEEAAGPLDPGPLNPEVGESGLGESGLGESGLGEPGLGESGLGESA
jgi:DNA-binding NarL/FixJ family response regulator